jgi:hypothetical protein
MYHSIPSQNCFASLPQKSVIAAATLCFNHLITECPRIDRVSVPARPGTDVMIFYKYFRQNNLPVFCSNYCQFFSEILTKTMVLEKNAIFPAENWRELRLYHRPQVCCTTLEINFETGL